MTNTVRAVLAGDTDGETINFGFRVSRDGAESEEMLSLPHHMLEAFLQSLLTLSERAHEIRARNPLHQGVKGGIVFDLAGLELGPMNQRPGWHHLGLQVRNKAGQNVTYRIASNAESLEILADQIFQYLASDDSQTKPAH